MLDYSLVADLPNPGAWFSLPKPLLGRVQQFAEFDARAFCSVSFAFRIGLDREYLAVEDSREMQFREGCLRASLADFVSLEEAAARDFDAVGLERDAPLFRDIPNPLLHIFLLIRHLNTHLAKSALSITTRAAVWEVDGRRHEFDYKVWTITGVSPTSLRSLRDSRHYSDLELKRLSDWFSEQQAQWGAPHMIRLAVEAYAETVVAAAT